jgi:hypothetical protein
MKKIIILMTLAVAGLFSSCGDILDIYPVENNQAEAFFANETEVYQGLAGVYARLARAGGDDLPSMVGLLLSETRSDNWYLAALPNADRSQATIRRMQISGSTDILVNAFNRLYSIIEGANTLIALVSEEEYPDVIAQARFLRGYAYFELVRGWGPVPVVTTPIEKQDALGYQRDPETKVYAQIIDDLDYAITNLPEAYEDAADIGRVTSLGARAVLAYAYVTMAGYPVNDATGYQKALGVLSPIINQLDSRFAPKFSDIFDFQQENKWDLFSIQFQSSRLVTGTVSGFGSSVMNYSTYNTFPQWTTGGNSMVDMRLDSLFVVPMREAGDTRAMDPIVTNGYWTVQNPPHDGPPTAEDITQGRWTRSRPYQLTKFLVKDPERIYVNGTTDSPLNYPVMRTADAYLLYAEALVATGKADEAKPWVDKIRVRAGIPPLTANPTMADIFDERRKEFIGEGKRYFDLIRQGETVFLETITTFMKYYGQDTDYMARLPTARDMLLPIPQAVMNSHTEWDQNDGY